MFLFVFIFLIFLFLVFVYLSIQRGCFSNGEMFSKSNSTASNTSTSSIDESESTFNDPYYRLNIYHFLCTHFFLFLSFSSSFFFSIFVNHYYFLLYLYFSRHTNGGSIRHVKTLKIAFWITRSQGSIWWWVSTCTCLVIFVRTYMWQSNIYRIFVFVFRDNHFVVFWIL